MAFRVVTFHTFRKTVATLLDGAGLTARQIADTLGRGCVRCCPSEPIREIYAANDGVYGVRNDAYRTALHGHVTRSPG